MVNQSRLRSSVKPYVSHQYEVHLLVLDLDLHTLQSSHNWACNEFEPGESDAGMQRIGGSELAQALCNSRTAGLLLCGKPTKSEMTRRKTHIRKDLSGGFASKLCTWERLGTPVFGV